MKRTTQVSETSPGRGKKECPVCHTIVTANSRKCSNCSHEFEKAKSQKKGRKPDPVMVVIEKVKQIGGIVKVSKILSDVATLQTKMDETLAQLAPLGGKEGAESALKIMGDLMEALKTK